ncbi:hypothetical protein C2E25_15145 [Geothermobacter hydrogeniphilus]|uniref:Glycosyltransferase subfamily 4-like N-terminal domain-containing protein n=1 Tax=Geothermobacter hydrogeniphilus TaxID=1969733 RepID=A0A2K2H6G8_9BACT|nr:glycosyltransferase family 4 protein [Geothermobacter hydrogeniphilus]PNU18898.1 hypothetical protein C2E25_15145 [Geothermobacter hydrogeniphilus]
MPFKQDDIGDVSQDAPSVLILYPWGIESVRKKNIGAGLRVGLLADFLLDKGFHVTVLSTGRSSWETEDRGILFRQLVFPSSFGLFCLYALVLLVSRIGRMPALQAFTYFFFPGFDQRFSARLIDIAEEHDVVLLEYPFWFEALGAGSKRLILTNHDVLSVSWTKEGPSFVNKFMFGKLLNRELAAMKSAHSSVVVSHSDAEYFRARGVQGIRVVTNPVALQEEELISPARGNNELEKTLEGFESAALFVGSGWIPNREAVKSIIEEIAPACPEIIFFIAGDCGKGIRCFAPNIRLLGSVEPAVLEDLYHIVKFCLIPVPWGTGTSLKAVEAMSRGKVIIATRVGVRGIPFEHGIHGIVCDDAKDYPAWIKTLLADSEKCSQMTCRAKLVAKNFDYRNVYGTYLELIDGFLNGK